MRNVLPHTSCCGPAGCRRLGRPSRRARRRGVSLLEVMFSIGVVMVGLAGIAALLPVAGIQANKGAGADAAARLGADAVRNFHVRSMANPTTWRLHTGANFATLTLPADLLRGTSFCIDPRFIAQGQVAGDQPGRARFPWVAPGNVLAMPRITLAPGPEALSNEIMGILLANQVFASDDSLVFDLPGDRTLGPVQSFSPGAPQPWARRNSTRSFSWMATLVPRLDRVGNITDQYTLSIVVFSRRIIDPTLTDENRASERVVAVETFYSGQPAIGGGDVQLRIRPGRRPDDLLIRSGDWVMLSGWKLTLTDSVQVHKWYRVVNAAGDPLEVPVGSGNWYLDVTLAGPDWDWQGLDPSRPNTQVTIARGAVAVFEKTIRLETSSLWTN